MTESCCERLRRDAVAADPILNGIDYLEMIDHDLPQDDPLRQRTALLHCLKPVAGLSDANVALTGGERIRDIVVQWAHPATPTPAELAGTGEASTAALVAAIADAANVLVVRFSQPGDYSTYTLSLRRTPVDPDPPAHFDPQLSSLDFNFKVECPSPFDCRPQRFCPPRAKETPQIDYLAKDFESFRRLMLDRMALIAPQWREDTVADYGVALVELLAYVGDQLSYQQDAVATEAYLETARRRVSLRRHAALVDYQMHDGCNARAWVQIEVAAPGFTLNAADTQFFTRCVGFAPGIDRSGDALRAALLLTPTVYEPLHAPTLYADHNSISFYTWGDKSCCLPRGATSATLAGHFPDLQAGDPLLFEEVVGPLTGAVGDADPTHRHVARLTKVVVADPESPSDPLKDPLTGALVTRIAWAKEDALPFPLCLSSIADATHGGAYLPQVSVARGNLVLVDHGRTIAQEPLGAAPAPRLFRAASGDGDPCARPEPTPIPARFQPRLQQGPLTQAATLQTDGAVDPVPAFDPQAPAADAMRWNMADVRPQITLDSVDGANAATWRARRSLLNSGAFQTHFVAEIDDDGATSLRFGDDTHGARPNVGERFTATYRIGNGAAGNVGAEAIAHFVAGARAADVTNVRNPLPARGGVDPETSARVRRNAPEAFETQERAVTPADYAAVTMRRPGVQRAAARMRWTGSWHTVFLTVDPEADADAAALKAALPGFIDRYRMAGHDLDFNEPRYVALSIGLHICVKPDYFRSDVRAGLLEALGSRDLPDGRRGLFHPDNLTFGQSVYLSAIYAAVHATAGVASAQATIFQRQGNDDPMPLRVGELTFGALEIARLDNDPNFPERGLLQLDLSGGK